MPTDVGGTPARAKAGTGIPVSPSSGFCPGHAGRRITDVLALSEGEEIAHGPPKLTIASQPVDLE